MVRERSGSCERASIHRRPAASRPSLVSASPSFQKVSLNLRQRQWCCEKAYGSFCLLQAVSRVASSPTRESGERAHVSPSSPDRWKAAGNVARRRPEAVTNACVSSTFCAHLIRHCLIYGGPCLNHGGGGRRDCLWRMKCSIYPEEALSATVSAVEDVCGLTVSRSEPSRCLHNLHISGNTGAWLALQRHPSLALVCWGIDGEGNGTCRHLTPAQQPYHAPRQRRQKQWAIVAANDVRCISKLFGGYSSLDPSEASDNSAGRPYRLPNLLIGYFTF